MGSAPAFAAFCLNASYGSVNAGTLNEAAASQVYSLPGARQVPIRPQPLSRLTGNVLANKYAGQFPLYQQPQNYGQEGITLDRSTLLDWAGRSAAPLESLAGVLPDRLTVKGAHRSGGPELPIPIALGPRPSL
ncbi:transposase [Leisingera sp. M523]|uniref:IS66 family transposase n=1 Tax=Leisingera sp. M523 TaxID=2867013 RepID=UPI0038FC5C8F